MRLSLLLVGSLALLGYVAAEPSMYEGRSGRRRSRRRRKNKSPRAQSEGAEDKFLTHNVQFGEDGYPMILAGDDDAAGGGYGDNYDQVKHDPYNYDYDESVDCVLGEWTGWTQCTNPCGGGVKNRLRDVLVQQHVRSVHALDRETATSYLYMTFGETGEWQGMRPADGRAELQ